MRTNQGRRTAYAIGMSSLLLMASCSTLEDSNVQQQVAAMSACDKIQALINGHSQGFEKARGAMSNAKSITVWRSKYHLVGNDCQVWGWGDGRFSYVCSLLEPNEASAQAHFTQAQQTAQSCLDDSWQLTLGNRTMGSGSRADFVQAGNNTVLSVVMLSSPALFGEEWHTYYFVGDVTKLK